MPLSDNMNRRFTEERATASRLGHIADTRQQALIGGNVIKQQHLPALIEDAHMIGRLALEKQVPEYAVAFKEWMEYQKNRPVKKRVDAAVLAGWSLTARLVQAPDTNRSPLVHVTMIGAKDLSLYQLEYDEHRRPPAIAKHQVATFGALRQDMYATYVAGRMSLPAPPKKVTDPPSSNLPTNPMKLTAETEPRHLSSLDIEAVEQGLFEFAQYFDLVVPSYTSPAGFPPVHRAGPTQGDEIT